MANPVVEASGSQTATGGGSEDTVSTITASRVLTFIVDGSNMVAGDTITLRAYRKVRSGDTLLELYREAFSYPLESPLLISVPVPSPHQAAFSITQESGTGKAFPWSVEST